MSADISERLNNFSVDAFLTYIDTAYNDFVVGSGHFYRAVNWTEASKQFSPGKSSLSFIMD